MYSPYNITSMLLFVMTAMLATKSKPNRSINGNKIKLAGFEKKPTDSLDSSFVVSFFAKSALDLELNVGLGFIAILACKNVVFSCSFTGKHVP